MTREELYEQVWKTPMSRLAANFGISDVALGKTCRRMNIPRPGRGYWQRLSARVPVKRIPLPKVAPKHQEWAFLGRVENPTPRAPLPKAPAVPVADTLQNAHEVVLQVGRLLQRAKPDEFGRLIVPGESAPMLAVTIETHRRALLLLDALSKGVSAQGHTVALHREKTDETVKAKLVFTVTGAVLEAAVVERLDRRERPRTKDEEARAETTSKIRDKPPPPAYEQFASGKLQVVIRNMGSPRATWSDGMAPLERHLGRIIVALEVEAERRRQVNEAVERERGEAERRRLEREEERRRLREQETCAKHELAMSRDLRGLARRWAVATQVRAFLEAIEDAVPVPDRGEGFTAWLRWANEHADQLDPLSEPHKIAMVLEPDLTKLDADEDERRP